MKLHIFGIRSVGAVVGGSVVLTLGLAVLHAGSAILAALPITPLGISSNRDAKCDVTAVKES